MVTRAECSKKFKKLCDWTVSTRKKEVRIAKDFSKLWANYSEVNDSISKKTKELSTVNATLQKKIKNVEALKRLEEERRKELENLQDQIKVLQEKIATIQSNESQDSEKNKSLQLQLLHEMALKACTKTYFDDSSPHLIRGFTANEGSSKVIPFEYDPERLTKDEIQNALWENCYQSSNYTKEWEQLFAEESVVKNAEVADGES